MTTDVHPWYEAALATSQQVHAPSLPVCRRHSARHTHPNTPSLPHIFTTLPRRRLTAPHLHGAASHRAYPARQRHQTRASPTNLGTLPHPPPSLPPKPPHLRRVSSSVFAQYHPTDASPALYAARPLAQWANADRSRSDRSCPRHSPSPALPVSPPLVCISQALHREAASYYARHVRDYAVLPRVDIRCHPISCTEIKLHAHVNSPKMWFHKTM